MEKVAAASAVDISVSVVSHLQIGLVAQLLADLDKSCRDSSFELILTLNLDETVPFAEISCASNLRWPFIYGIGWNPRLIFISGHSIPGFSKRVIPWRQFKRSIWIPSGLGLVCSTRRKPNARNSSATS